MTLDLGHRTLDVVVVGGGPAGSAAAIRLKQIGLRVKLYEKARFPRQKLCGGFLSSESLADLDALGVLPDIRAAGALTVNRVKIASSRGRHSEIHFAAPGLSLSRNVLDDILLRRAAEVGVDIRQGTDGIPHLEEAPWAVIATGRNKSQLSGSFYGIQAFFIDTEGISDQVELDLVPGGYVGLVRQGEYVNLCALTTQSVVQTTGPSLDTVLAHWSKRNPVLSRHLKEARRLSPWQAVGPVVMGFRRLVGDHRFYTGDAACIVDPFAGEGIAMGLKSSALLQSAFLQSSRPIEKAYAQSWHQTYDRALQIDGWLRFLLGRPVLQEVCLLGMRIFPAFLGWITNITRPKCTAEIPPYSPLCKRGVQGDFLG